MSAAVTAFTETTTNYERLLDTVVRTVAEVVPDTCVVSLRSEHDDTLTVVAVHDADPRVVEAYAQMIGQPRPLSEFSAQALARGTTFLPEIDLADLERNAPKDSLDLLRTIGARGMLVVPLKSRGELLGLLSVTRRRPDLPPLDDVDRELVEHLANHAALALGNAMLFRELLRSENLRELAARAAEANRFVDVILEHIPDMVFVKDAEKLEFVRFNRAGEELLGFPRTELIGKSDRDFFPPGEAEFFIAKDRETLASGVLVDIPEEPIRTKHGPRWLHTKKVPIVDDAGVPRFLLGISHDITERKAAEAALKAAKDNAEAANRELEAFSYSVAHDLRAPLRAIDGFAQALIEDYSTKIDGDGQRHLDRIRAAAQRMALLIDDLLELSRVTRAEHKVQPIDLATIARTAFSILERGEPDRKVTFAAPTKLPAVADPKLVAIVFDNLLGNAWKFTSKISAPQIELGTRVDANERIYYVRDNGAGFDMSYREKLFGVFQRLHPTSEFPGTGIGLATVKRIVERHGGRVWAEGEVGKGATFYFTLPETP
ncbi:MAG: PAS domain-containing protein [Kofleriaceae bacterium]|nr:PAS domain-containing protein [Kofleriaceae bacterium]